MAEDEERNQERALEQALEKARWTLFLVIAGALSLVGLFVIISAVYGLPFAAKSDVDTLKAEYAQVVKDQATISTTQAVTSANLKAVADTVSEIREQQRATAAATQDNSLHIEGLEADIKALDAIHESRRARGLQ